MRNETRLLISLVGVRFDRGMGEYIRLYLPYLCEEFKDNLLIVSNSQLPSDLLQIITKYNCKLLIKKIPTPIFEQFYIPYIIKQFNIKTAYFPANTFPLIKVKDVRYIVTIHDLIFLRKDIKPQKLYQKFGKFYRAFILKKGIKKIDTILTVSYATLNEIKKVFNDISLTEDNVIYNPFDFSKHIGNDDSILEQLNLKKNSYFYTISGIADNKNLEFVFKAFSKLKTVDANIKLVVSGVPNKQDQQSYSRLLNSLNIKDSVIFTNYISNEQKASLILNAKAFLFLSKSEGFGRPIVEALLHGAAVIASDIEIFREIGDKYIHYVNINDENCLVNLIDLFKNSHQNNIYEVHNYLRTKFDVDILSKKLIKKLYNTIEEKND
jgi:glycosyltransferase involved in cell wall biosynthesis